MANDSSHARNHKQYLYLLCGITHGLLEAAKSQENSLNLPLRT